MSNKQIKIEYTALENLNPYKGNPKVHDEKQIQQIAKSIERFGFNNPILIDEKSEVIAGHGRLLAAKLKKQFRWFALYIFLKRKNGLTA